LRKQITYCAVVTHLRRGELAGENMMMFINRQMQFALGAPCWDDVLFLVPFVFAVNLQSCAVDDDHAAWHHCFGQQDN